MNALKIIIGFVIVGVLLIFLILNGGQSVDVNVFGKVYHNIPLSLMILYSFLFGIISMGLLAFINEIKLRRELPRTSREMKKMKEELDTLRNLPLEKGE